MKPIITIILTAAACIYFYMIRTTKIQSETYHSDAIYEISAKDTNEDLGCYTYTLIRIINGQPVIMYLQHDSLLVPNKNQISITIK